MQAKKIILFNIIAILVIYLFAELGFYLYFCDRIGFKIPYFQPVDRLIDCYPPTGFVPIEKADKTHSKPPVLAIGCSYTHGDLLPENENYPAKLSKLTKRHVYNWGISGHGLPATLSVFKSEHKNHLIKTPPEYIIYTYMFHHPARWSYWDFYNLFRKENLIPFQKYNILYNSYIYQYFKNIEIDNYYNNNFERQYTLYLDILKKIKEECETLFPNAKCVVLLYSDINYDLCEGITGKDNSNKEGVEYLFKLLYSQKLRKDFEDLGFTVISTEELTGRKMDKKEDRVPKDPNHPHPSVSAWNEIVPKLVKKLNL